MHVVVAANHPVDRTLHSLGGTGARATACQAAKATRPCRSPGTGRWFRPRTRFPASLEVATRFRNCRRRITIASAVTGEP